MYVLYMLYSVMAAVLHILFILHNHQLSANVGTRTLIQYAYTITRSAVFYIISSIISLHVCDLIFFALLYTNERIGMSSQFFQFTCFILEAFSIFSLPVMLCKLIMLRWW